MSDKCLIYIAKADIISRNYSYLIVDKVSKQAAVIDPAWQFESFNRIMTENKYILSLVLLTHSHYDHTNLVDDLVNRYSIKVFMSLKEIEYYSYKCENLYELYDGDIISIGSTSISCMSTPGHTAGGMCYILNDLMFTGDTIFIEGCGICNEKGGCPSLMFDSIQRVKREVHGHTKIYSGHSYGKEPGNQLNYLLKMNVYMQLDNIDVFIKFRMRNNQKRLFDFK